MSDERVQTMKHLLRFPCNLCVNKPHPPFRISIFSSSSWGGQPETTASLQTLSAMVVVVQSACEIQRPSSSQCASCGSGPSRRPDSGDIATLPASLTLTAFGRSRGMTPEVLESLFNVLDNNRVVATMASSEQTRQVSRQARCSCKPLLSAEKPQLRGRMQSRTTGSEGRFHCALEVQQERNVAQKR
jgi:hypothetical protein